ncbi:hypothetical protein ASG43_03345 [Aureimonas sp. Leaf454]|uniref:phage adaptor protein n=1 Tax=Aureimonas sp. Leaf454 TaxID=1736381 RepID=UPI0006F646D3|nr:hypothetical protein [Aureimonas sp. Leaf454]KQT54635.1 hypothetical protein ASG43_03345 [Aureimonas sp. Leaf454]
MATFLQLVQKVARDSGTVSGTQPTTVAGQTGRLAKIVHWTNDAYRQIQNVHGAWNWMQGEFSGATVPGTSAYSSRLSRFAEYVCTGEDEDRYSLFDPALGRESEAPLRFVDYRTFYATQLRGAQAVRQGRPNLFSIDPSGALCLSPTPDKVYTIRGPYRKDVQELDANNDVPEMPPRFHDLIVDGALVMLTTHDEGAPTLTLYQLRQLRGFSQLERDQLPRIAFGGTLA